VPEDCCFHDKPLLKIGLQGLYSINVWLDYASAARIGIKWQRDQQRGVVGLFWRTLRSDCIGRKLTTNLHTIDT